MTPELFFLLALFHGAVALATTGANLYLSHRRLVSGAVRDAEGLRLALAAELLNLRALYRDNIEAIYSGQEALASCRMFSVVYRANLARLHTLAASRVPEIVTAYALSERVEALAAVHCKAHGANGFSMGRDRPFADALIAKYEMAEAAAARALRGLGEEENEGLAGSAEAQAERPARRLLAA